jgi:bifunctional non-homologous end joining protein LigD
MRSAAVSDDLEQCVFDDLASLVWGANMAALELHTPQARVSSPDRPDSMVFDLDPGPGATILDCCRVGLDLRGLLAELGLESVAKSSGSKGLHLAVPLHTDTTDDDTKGFARAAGQLLAKREPDRVTVVMKKEQRSGKVFVDWSQNDEHKTTVCAYSLRGKERPMVSTPVAWDEVSDALDAKDPDALTFEADDVLGRVESVGDVYAPNLELEQELPPLGRQSTERK